MDLIEIIQALGERKKELDLFKRGPLIVTANCSTKGILDPTLPDKIRSRIATDIVWSRATGKKLVRIQGVPKEYWHVIDYGGMDSYTGIGERNFYHNTPLVQVFPEKANIQAKINIALLPKETEEQRKFREEEFLREAKFISEFPGVAVGERGEGGELHGTKLYRVDTAALEYCKEKYGDTVAGFSDPHLSQYMPGAIGEIAWFGNWEVTQTGIILKEPQIRMRDLIAAVGTNSIINKRFKREMFEALLTPYISSLREKAAAIVQSLHFDGPGIKVLNTRREDIPYPELFCQYTFRQPLDSYREAARLIDRLQTSFTSEIYERKDELGTTRIEFKDLPPDSEIEEVYHRLSPETYQEGKAKVGVRIIRPFDPAKDTYDFDPLGSSMPPKNCVEYKVVE